MSANPFPLFAFKRTNTHKRPHLWAKLGRFEYWPTWLAYLPLVPLLLKLMWRARSLTFMTSANPGIEMGGFFGESKIDILRKIPPAFLPHTLFFPKGTPSQEVMRSLGPEGLCFPLIVKPNVGERGFKVAKITSEAELNTHLQTMPGDFLVQEFIEAPLELGVLCHRMPGQESVRISSITIKAFMQVEGDGHQCVGQLLKQDLHFGLQARRIGQENPQLYAYVPAQGEVVLVEPIGNHCRGTKFRSGMHLCLPALEDVFAPILRAMPGVYYGRFDLRVSSVEDLYQGQNLKILEFNGVSADPGHVYDPALSWREVYRVLAQHLRLVFAISQQSRAMGHRDTPAKEVFKKLWQHFFLYS